MLNTGNKVADAGKLTAVADASFVIGISLCQQWDILEVLVEKLIIANKVWEELLSEEKDDQAKKNCNKQLLLKDEPFPTHQRLQC